MFTLTQVVYQFSLFIFQCALCTFKYFLYHGGVAQLVEHLPCKQGVRSSTLLISTILSIVVYIGSIILHIEKYIVKIKLDTRLKTVRK